MGKEKKNKIKTKHIFVRPDIHEKIKESAKLSGKKIQHFTNELIEWGLEYQKFLAKK
jgi:hypothetical protein